MIAILAYGSLIDDPGFELEIVETVPVTTPFPIEYARSSRKRGGGPTLVPVQDGLKTSARLLVLAPSTTVEDAKNKLWRRETGNEVGSYNPPSVPTPNTVLIDELDSFPGFRVVLATRIAPNISPLSPDRLADLAIRSARDSKVRKGEDGISYLLRTRSAGVITRLSNDYASAILERMEACSLAHALLLAQQDRM